MLSAETAAGKFPVETVEHMAAIALEAERAEEVRSRPTSPTSTSAASTRRSRWARCSPRTTWAARRSLALTESGSTALWMSRHLIHVPIFGLTSQATIAAPHGAVPQRAADADAFVQRPRRGARRGRAPAGRSAACSSPATPTLSPAASRWATRVAPICSRWAESPDSPLRAIFGHVHCSHERAYRPERCAVKSTP